MRNFHRFRRYTLALALIFPLLGSTLPPAASDRATPLIPLGSGVFTNSGQI